MRDGKTTKQQSQIHCASGRHHCNLPASFWWQQKKKKKKTVTPVSVCWLRTQRWHSGTIRTGIRLFRFSHRHHQDLLGVICLQLGDGVLAVLIFLTGIIAVMTGFAQACENKHYFGFSEVLVTEPRIGVVHADDITPVQSFFHSSSDQVLPLLSWMSKGFNEIFFSPLFYRGPPPALMCWELCRNAALQERLAVASILAQCPDIVIHNISDGYISIQRLYHWLMWHIRKGGGGHISVCFAEHPL